MSWRKTLPLVDAPRLGLSWEVVDGKTDTATILPVSRLVNAINLRLRPLVGLESRGIIATETRRHGDTESAERRVQCSVPSVSPWPIFLPASPSKVMRSSLT